MEARWFLVATLEKMVWVPEMAIAAFRRWRLQRKKWYIQSTGTCLICLQWQRQPHHFTAPLSRSDQRGMCVPSPVSVVATKVSYSNLLSWLEDRMRKLGIAFAVRCDVIYVVQVLAVYFWPVQLCRETGKLLGSATLAGFRGNAPSKIATELIVCYTHENAPVPCRRPDLGSTLLDSCFWEREIASEHQLSVMIAKANSIENWRRDAAFCEWR
jgi:hypothetical protein